MSVEIIEVVGAPTEVRDLLYEVLYKNYGVDELFDNWFHQEKGGEFLLKRDDQDRLLGVVRLMPIENNDPARRQVRQVAVSPEVRGLGIGSELMRYIEELALDQCAEELWLESRGVAYDFYRKMGFEIAGEEFISKLTCLPHCVMTKQIGNAANAVVAAPEVVEVTVNATVL